MAGILSPQLLEALMSPNNDMRGQAELVYNSITPISSRVEGLMKLLLDFTSTTATTTTTNTTTLSVFVCILLRRDILKLDSPTMLEQLVDPLLQCFLSLQSQQQQQQQQQIQNGIGHCLAEICASLSILPLVQGVKNNHNNAAGSTVDMATPTLTKIVQRIEPMLSSCSAASAASAMALLCMLADRSPVCYTQVVVPQLSQILQQQQQQSSSSTTTSSLLWSTIELCLRLVMSSAIATTVEKVSLIPQHHQQQREMDDGADYDVRIDPTSVAAQLGVSCLSPLLQSMIQATTSTMSATTIVGHQEQEHHQEYLQQQCYQHLSHVAMTVPSLLAGSVDVFRLVVQLIVGVTQQQQQHTTTTELCLSSLQVLANLCSVADVRHTTLSNNPTLVQQICQHSIPLCVQIMSNGCITTTTNTSSGGEDDDENENNMEDELIEWISEPANLLDTNAGYGEASFSSTNDTAVSLAQSLLESFLSSLAGPALTIALPLAQQLLQQPVHSGSRDCWTNVWAGLVVLESAIVASPYALAPHVHDLVQAGCTQYTKNAVSAAGGGGGTAAMAIVQYQSLRLLATLCEAPVSSIRMNINSQFAQAILERFAAALSSPVSKLSVMGSTGIISYCRGGGDVTADSGGSEGTSVTVSQSLAPFIGHLLQALINGPLSIVGTDTGSIAVRVRAMDATACLAAISSEDDDDDDGSLSFAPFYSTVMPGLMATAQLPQPDLATSALRSLAIVGSAVGDDLFRSDAKKVLSWILPVLGSSGSTENSVSTEELLTATARIASVLKAEFAPYIESTIPTILRIAQESNDVSIAEGNESGVSDTSGESMTVAIPGQGWKKLSINTYKIQEKASNNRVLYELAKALGSSLGPHVQKLLDVVIPLINFPYSSDVRSTAAQASAALFECACSSGAELYGGNMQCPQHYLPLLSEAISRQISQEDAADKEALFGSADSLSEVFYITHDKFSSFRSVILLKFSVKDAEAVVQLCLKTLLDCLKRRSSITKMLQGNLTGLDEKEEYESVLQAEDGLLTPLTDSIGYLVKFFGPAFVPVFDKYISPILSQYISSMTDTRASTAAFCLFDDCIEYGGQEAAEKYSPVLLPGINTVLRNPSEYDVDLIQASVYGVSQIARYAPQQFLSASVPTLVQQLMLLTQGSKEDSPVGEYLFEISISALGSLVLWGPFQNLKGLNKDTIQDRFLASLPIQQNNDEAKICHSNLCHLLETGSISLQSNAYRLIQVIGAILYDVEEGEDVADVDTCNRLVTILFQLQQQSPQTVQKGYEGLDAGFQAAINSALQGAQQSQYRANVVTPEK